MSNGMKKSQRDWDRMKDWREKLNIDYALNGADFNNWARIENTSMYDKNLGYIASPYVFLHHLDMSKISGSWVLRSPRQISDVCWTNARLKFEMNLNLPNCFHLMIAKMAWHAAHAAYEARKK